MVCIVVITKQYIFLFFFNYINLIKIMKKNIKTCDYFKILLTVVFFIILKFDITSKYFLVMYYFFNMF